LKRCCYLSLATHATIGTQYVTANALQRADAAGSPSALNVAPVWPHFVPLRGGHGQRTAG